MTNEPTIGQLLAPAQLWDMFIEDLLRIERGYVNDPDDSGGETNYGITKGVARANGYMGPMETMPRSFAVRIYKEKYWDSIGGDRLAKALPETSLELADSCVNVGVGRASRWLQRSLNVLNNNQRYWKDILVDGDVGPATLAACEALRARRGLDGDSVMWKMLDSLQGAFYIDLAERRSKDERFIFGWFANRVR